MARTKGSKNKPKEINGIVVTPKPRKAKFIGAVEAIQSLMVILGGFDITAISDDTEMSDIEAALDCLTRASALAQEALKSIMPIYEGRQREAARIAENEALKTRNEELEVQLAAAQEALRVAGHSEQMAKLKPSKKFAGIIARREEAPKEASVPDEIV